MEIPWGIEPKKYNRNKASLCRFVGEANNSSQQRVEWGGNYSSSAGYVYELRRNKDVYREDNPKYNDDDLPECYSRFLVPFDIVEL